MTFGVVQETGKLVLEVRGYDREPVRRACAGVLFGDLQVARVVRRALPVEIVALVERIDVLHVERACFHHPVGCAALRDNLRKSLLDGYVLPLGEEIGGRVESAEA